MGFRLRLIHRMQRRQDPWPAWGNYGTLLRHGFVTTALILLFHLPAAACALAAWFAESRPLAAAFWVLAAAVLIPALYILPGFMTFYAREYDLGELLDFRRALRRVRAGGAAYRKAWLIVLPATGVSMLGVAVLGVGFAFTSVWLWQVAAFCFARVFSERFDLLVPTPVCNAETEPATPLGKHPTPLSHSP